MTGMRWLRGSVVLAVVLAVLAGSAYLGVRHERAAVAWYCPAPPVTC
jgi:hypothetical protein